MFRSAIIRSARCATRSGVRSFSAIGRPVVKSFIPSSSRFAPAIVQVSRCYSSAAGLAKPEVEGRIVDLLKNFDKVSWRLWWLLEALLIFLCRLRIHRRYYFGRHQSPWHSKLITTSSHLHRTSRMILVWIVWIRLRWWWRLRRLVQPTLQLCMGLTAS
jgi:hypothetical protein